MIAVALGVGYFIGSLPTAGLLGRLWEVDLVKDGSGNPGANNARRLGGLGLAIVVLAVELAKGVAAVLVGAAIAGDAGAIAAGIGAAGGNVYNIWYQFGGGKGLAISAGVLVAAWPTVFGPVLGVLIITLVIVRSSGAAALVALAFLNAMALMWVANSWPMAWGVEATYWLVALSLGLTLILSPKHWYDFRNRLPVSR